ncbi:sigma-E processing peptidase SpoIIGA [Virgibacillus halophilus]|uniref:Sporulation sigma-E factor-processing peptidase n=1 Tax=Tigheibacillus halophilus TaxID=361280 RepID=A0ABU5CAG4_9BACI|nr:sigma-E processing peptidase SpoIIGA [Virgibacillus halophilus]
MAVYLDVVWALNLLLDWMLILLTQALTREKTKQFRIFTGALFASSIVPVTIYFPDSFLNTIIGKLLFSIAIILISFRFNTVNRTLRVLAMFYFVTFSIGGGMIAVHFIAQRPAVINPDGMLTMNQGFGDPVSWLLVLIGFPLVWYFTKRRMDKHAAAKIKYDQLYPVSITIRDETYLTDGYIDSGNQLTDPLTKRCVVICDEIFLKNWFRENEWAMLKKAHEHLELEAIPERWQGYIQLVPFHGVEGKNGFLFAIRPDKLMIQYGKQEVAATKVLIGIQFGRLAKDQTYHCLLHPQILKLYAADTA